MKFSKDYPLQPFQSDDWLKITQIIRAYPLATIAVNAGLAPEIVQIPLILQSDGLISRMLAGHVDRNNPFTSAIENRTPASVLFSGPSSYISPSIYPDTQYPGWNYFSVHIQGTLIPMDSDEALTSLLVETARQNEPAESGYTLTPDQPRFVQLLDYIVGFTIEIDHACAVLKLAQDKPASHKRIAADHFTTRAKQDISPLVNMLIE